MAVTSLQPDALAPGLPTMAASGMPGYEVMSLYSVWLPAGTPAAIVDRLSQEILRVLAHADVKEEFVSVGVETVGSSRWRCDLKWTGWAS